MKHLLPALFLLITAAPLLANDDGGDGAIIPSYQELVREGYGPRSHYDSDTYYLALNYGTHVAPKPTQAYYGRGYTLYYGYQMVRVYEGQENNLYAFGYPVSYFRKLLPPNIDESNIGSVAVEVRHSAYYQPGDYVAQRHYLNTTTTVTSVQPVKAVAHPGTVPAFRTAAAPSAGLPPIGEKPAH